MSRLTLSAAAAGLTFAVGIGLVVLYHFIGEPVAWLTIGSGAVFAVVYLADLVTELRKQGE